jgi:hypothetical protein
MELSKSGSLEIFAWELGKLKAESVGIQEVREKDGGTERADRL